MSVEPGIERRSMSPAGRRRRGLFDLLHTLERASYTGLLRLSSSEGEVGVVLAQDGTVCFAHAKPASGLDPVEAGDRDARAELSALACRARKAGDTLCATILREPELTVASLRSQLCLETAEALRTLAEWSSQETLLRRLEPANGGYDPRLTFGSAEMFTAAVSLDEPPGRTGTMDLFDGFRASGGQGLLLSREPGHESAPYPISCYGIGRATLQDLMIRCRFAGELMRPATVLGGTTQPTYAALRDVDGRQWVCVGRERHLALIERDAGVDLAPVIAHSMRLH